MYNTIIETGLYTTITTSTRNEKKVGYKESQTLIDVIMTTMANTAITSGTIAPQITDHLPIYASFDMHEDRITNNKRKTLSTARYKRNKEKILPTIKTKINDIQKQLDAQTTSQQLQQIMLAITQGIDLEEHERTPKMRKKKWCSKKLTRLINRQH